MVEIALERDIALTRLANGVTVITEPVAAVRSVAFGVWIGTGSRCERPRENGISHFIEHMLFKGTERRTAEDIAREMDTLGGHLDAFTGRELVGFNTKVLDEHVSEAFDIIADMVLHPRFDEEEIQKEKGVILEELKMENDNPESVVHELFVSNFWKRHPLGRPIIGTKKTITAFEREAIVNYHRRFYAPANLTITAAGNLKHEQIVELAERHFGGLPQGGEIPKLTKPEAEAPLILKNRRSLEQVHLCIGAPCYEMTHPLRFACYTLNVILGGSMSSRLFQNVRERLGLAYSIFSELSQYQDSGCLAVYAGTSAETVGKLVACVMEEFRRLKEEPVAAEELRRAKEHMKGSMLLSLESTSSRMGNLARQWLSFGRFFTLDELAASIDAVTAEQVQAVAREFFVTEKIGVTMLGRLDSVSLGRENLIC